MVENMQYFTFSFAKNKYLIYHFVVDGAGGLQLVTKVTFKQAITKAKKECEGAIRTRKNPPKCNQCICNYV